MTRLRILLIWGVALGTTAARAADYAWWPLNDGQGDVAHNAVAGGAAGTIIDANTGGLGSGGSVWVNDPIRGTVLGLNGTTSWVDAGELPIMSMDSQFSWSFWAKQSGTQAVNNDIIIGNRYATGGAGGVDTVPREFVKFTPTQFEFHMDGNGVGNIAYSPFGAPAGAGTDIPNNDQWIHHAVVKHGDTLSYYRNGDLANARVIPEGMSSSDPFPFVLGGQNGVETWRGYLSDVQLYTSALDVTGVTATMNDQLAAGNLYARWKLDDGDGDTAADSGPNNFDGTIFDWDTDGLAGDGSVWVDDPTRGKVLGLGGNTAWVEAGELPLMDLDNDFTWAFWAREDPGQASPANDIILGNRYDATGAESVPREFIKFTPDRFEFHMNATGSGDLQYSDVNGPWVNHIVVKDGDSLKYYRDGELEGEATITQDQLSPDPLPFVMGGQEGIETWAGFLSDVRLFDHSLSLSEIASLSSSSNAVTGDFDNNGGLDVADVNLLIAAIGSGNAAFDLNGDSNVDELDLGIWVRDLKHTWIGDADLNGEFNSADFVQVFQRGEYEDAIVGNSTWEDGDWNGSGDFDSSDFVAAFQDGGYEKGTRAAVSAVPEPSTILLCLLGLPVLASVRRRLA